jgi:hypothetical protein
VAGAGERPVLVAGGDRDPNLAALLAGLAAARVPARGLLVGAQTRPWLAWDLDDDRLILDGEALTPRAAFLRHDVFTQLADPRPQPGARAMAWSAALQGWLLAHPEVRCPNRAGAAGPSNKPYLLVLARALGLAVPRTIVTNHADLARTLAGGVPMLDAAGTGAAPARDEGAGRWIAKPVAGGALTRELGDALAEAGPGPVLAAPALVQERLVAPELRIFVVGDATHAFEVRSPALDYRADDAVELAYLGRGPSPAAEQVRALARQCGLDYAAADLKSRADGTLVFLELNTAPMFARFDRASGGALVRSLVDWLAA